MAASSLDAMLLGLSDGDLDPDRFRSSFLTNKVGGRADWLPGVTRPLPRCGVCACALAQVVQVYCPLVDSHRNIHLFACVRGECSGHARSWKVLRAQRTRTAAPPPREKITSGSEWCAGAEDWGEEEEEEEPGGGEQQPITGQQSGQQPVCVRLQDLSLAPVLRSLFISVVEEEQQQEEAELLDRARTLLMEYERREGGVAAASSGVGERYEKNLPRHGDEIFSRFMEAISGCPQQILRYQRGGEPLYVSAPPEDLRIPVCAYCGAARTFELQLMPALVGMLGAELEFGTVLVYTCDASCWTDGTPREEFCYVQMDPDQELFAGPIHEKTQK